jgi:hypothetical protein
MFSSRLIDFILFILLDIRVLHFQVVKDNHISLVKKEEVEVLKTDMPPKRETKKILD